MFESWYASRPTPESAAVLDRVREAGRSEAQAAARRLVAAGELFVLRLRDSGEQADWAMDTAHGWTPRDLNQLITDWLGVGHWIADSPHKPIGLLGAILAWYGRDNLAERPAALDEAREAAELAADRARIAAQLAEDPAAAQARTAGRAAIGGPGHTAARAEAIRLARRAAQRRTNAAAAHTAALDAAIRRARSLKCNDDGA